MNDLRTAAQQALDSINVQAKGLTPPRITPADIEANIASEHYFTALDGAIHANGDKLPSGNKVALSLLTFCVLVLRNGFTVTGESACASPENFDAEIGRKVARANAVNKVWPLMGYVLKERLAQEQAEPVQEPLTDEEIALISAECAASHQHTDWHFARAIERAHKIGV